MTAVLLADVRAPRVLRHLPDWKTRGVCASWPDPETWFAEDAAGVALAKALCAGCPVADACLDDALARGEAWGVWGGLTAAERRRLAARRGFPRPSVRGASQHGQRSRYIGGCRCGRCTEANTSYVAGWRTSRRWPVTPRLTIVVSVLEVPRGRGAHRAWPGQLVIEGVSA